MKYRHFKGGLYEFICEARPVYCTVYSGPFRASHKCQAKARCAGKGRSLGKRRNAGMALVGGSLRACRWRAICDVVRA